MAFAQSRKKNLFTIIKLVVLILLVLIFFLPLISMVVTSLKAREELFVVPPVVFPKVAQWGNYILAWTMVRFGKFLVNSVILSFFYAAPCILSSCFAGYAFSRFQIRESRGVFLLVLSTMMIPYMVTVVPLYLIVTRVGLTDKRWLWLFFGMQGAPFLIFLFRQYFSTIPLSFEESARLDGARRFQVFFYIMFPLVQTGVIIAAIFAIQWSWADFLQPTLFLRGEKLTLAVKLARGYVDQKESVLYHVGMAGLLYYTLPIVVLFFALQRRFIAGLLSGGLKG
ncbi:MAG: carbohydrate ABC transporter permease [Candidatus Atribacteria bacterium]|nr:carbohydrate ABC transporter permease [Candidatus Atribacteria bacterium]